VPKKRILGDKNIPNEGMQIEENLQESSDNDSSTDILDEDGFSFNDDDHFSFDEEDSVEFDNCKNKNLCKELREWAIRNRVPHNHITDLLKCLNRCGIDGVPSTARTLIGSYSSNIPLAKFMDPGQYCYFGIQNHFLTKKNIMPSDSDHVLIDIGIDGLRLLNSSHKGLWPILGSIVGNSHERPFVIACYSGISKPKNVNDFLKDICEEVRSLETNGLFINESSVVSFSVRLFTCDTPARVYVTGIQYYSGKNACPKCEQKGEHLNGRVAYSLKSGKLRSDEDFSSRTDPTHHAVPFRSERHILESINTKMVSQFPLDPMHLIDLGVTKKWLELVIKDVNVVEMNRRLQFLVQFTPSEFGRQSRPFTDIKLWKATEFRQFLLYTGIFVLKDCVKNDIYYNFLLLHSAIRLLSCERTCQSELKVAQQILEDFVDLFSKIFGRHLVSSNVHNLLHISECVRLYGPLDSFSAYKFENHMQLIKKVLRKPNQMLQQLYFRMAEINTLSDEEASRSDLKFTSNFVKEKDSFCFIKNRGPCKIVAMGQKDGKKTFYGFCFKKSSALFEAPVDSMDCLGILVGEDMEETMSMFFEEDISYKYFVIPDNDKHIFIPLLHIFHEFSY